MKDVEACRRKESKKCYYIVQGFDLEYYKGKEIDNTKKKMTRGQMMIFAKKQLKFNKEQGIDKELTQKDLSQPINAWVYLKNIGLGVKTNCKRW
jgi:hypothetical protein